MLKRVMITGATGRTGSLVYRRVQTAPGWSPLGFARSPEKVTETLGTEADVVIGDVLNRADLDRAIAGCDALVILTSAMPIPQMPIEPGSRPTFTFAERGTPEVVDYQGQLNQIDAAIAAGISRIVLVGSMGGTNDQHPLNSLGNGNILIWKRKAEEYLMASGADYTIIHAGGLIDAPGGERQLVLGQRDEFLQTPPSGGSTSVPRADVAEVVVQALYHGSASRKRFDLVSLDPAEQAIAQDFEALFAQVPASD
jgi:uncharacterized protein YbjT (DUF2867 family)